ncbi:MAG: hypothetical protein KIT69_08610, partial [Propionibacteriaceae bacterium]|nr:hypothetical protein [Propionibacteriaceae bacterium]
GLHMDAAAGGKVVTVSAGVGLAQNGSGVAGSAAVNDIGDQVTAFIDGLAAGQVIKLGRALIMTAEYGADLSAGAGELAAGTRSVGAAVAVNHITVGVDAHLGTATIQAGDTVQVEAYIEGTTVDTVAVGAEGAQDFALGGSVAVAATDTATYAYAQGASVATPASVNIAAEGAMTFVTVAGNLAGVRGGADPGVVAIGAANATLVRKDKTQAWAASGSIDFGGAVGDVLDVLTAVAGELSENSDFTGLSVTAVSRDTITTASGGGAVANAPVAAAGSASATVLDKATQVTLPESLVLPGKQATNLNVFAYDSSEVSTGAGGFAAAKTVGVGAAVDVISLTKNTGVWFYVNGATVLSGNAAIQALSKENLLSVAVGAGLSEKVSIAGAASTYVLDLLTRAAIGDNATSMPQITTGGSFRLTAQDDTVIDQFPGGLDAAGAIGAGAATAVVDVKNKLVDAFVANHVQITANAAAGTAAIEAATGEFDVDYVSPSGQSGDVQPPDISIDLGHQTGRADAPAFSNPNLTKERQAAPVFEAMRGIAVSALNTARIKALTFAVGGAATAEVNVDAGATVVNMTTHTRIGGAVSLVSEGDVVLASSADLQKLGVTGSAAVAGDGSGAAGVDVTLVSMDTGTDLWGLAGATTTIAAGSVGSVIVNSQAQQDILAVTAGFAGSGIVGLDAGATVVDIDNTTYAGVISGDIGIKAGDNVWIAAADDTVIGAVAGEAAVGVAGGGFGGSTAVTLITKRTSAVLTDGSTVDAAAAGSGSMTVLTGLPPASGEKLVTKEISGVAIQALSSETVEAIAVGGGGGAYVGAGAGTTYTMIDSDTAVRVDGGAMINPGGGGTTRQSVSLAAGNVVDVLTVGGGLGLGLGGLGAGVDVGAIRNDTGVVVGGGSAVDAVGTVDVVAVGLTDLDSYAMAAGGGAVGVAGSVSVWSIGTGIDSSYSDTTKSADALSFNHGSGANGSVPASADTQTQRSDITQLLNAYGSTGGANSSQIAAATGSVASDYAAAQPQGAVQQHFADKTTSGVSATVEAGATITAGSLNVGAVTQVTSNQITGGASGGLVAVGGAVSVLNRGDATTTLMNGTANITGVLDVTAASVSTIGGAAYAGSVGGIAALGAQVVVINDAGSAAATVGTDAVISRAGGGLNVLSSLVTGVTAAATGLEVGLVGAAGAAVSDVKVTGGSAARVAGASVTAQSLTVESTVDITTGQTSKSSAAGIGVAGVGNVSRFTATPGVYAAVDTTPAPGQYRIVGPVRLNATSNIAGAVTAEGFSEGLLLSAGASIASATVAPTAAAYIGTAITLNADYGPVTVNATTSEDMTVEAYANGGASLIGSGAGAVANADVTNNTSAYILGNVTSFEDITISAMHTEGKVTAVANGVVEQGAIDVGYSQAEASMNATVLAYIDHGTVRTTQDGSDISIIAGEGDQGNPTGPTARAYSSQGVYAAGDHLQAEAHVTHNPTVKAFIGSPGGSAAGSTADVVSAGRLLVTASSWTVAASSVDNGPNNAFAAKSVAEADVTADKITVAYLGAGARASAENAQAIFTVGSSEDFYPEASGANGDGLQAVGQSTVNIWLNRNTGVEIGAGATLDAWEIDLVAASYTTASGSLGDNQGNGGFNATFYAGQKDALSGNATADVNLNLGTNWSGATPASTYIRIDGALTASTIELSANTWYSISLGG